LSVNTKRLKKIEYWFSDSHNNLVQMNVETNNPLNSLLEKVITNGSIELEGRYATRNRDGNEFLRVEKYKFV
jgi:CRISPR/Cas system CSM-associated protein Csm4 (group 5 of RAMP superfamily)